MGDDGIAPRRRPQLLAQGLDVGIYGAGIAVIGMLPRGLHQLLTAEHPFRLADQGLQQTELVAGQGQYMTVVAELAAVRVTLPGPAGVTVMVVATGGWSAGKRRQMTRMRETISRGLKGLAQ